jgi:hypothetical protein
MFRASQLPWREGPGPYLQAPQDEKLLDVIVGQVLVRPGVGQLVEHRLLGRCREIEEAAYVDAEFRLVPEETRMPGAGLLLIMERHVDSGQVQVGPGKPGAGPP